MPEFANRLKQIRVERKITQKELANYLNVSQNAVFNWENGKRQPTMTTISKIAEYFNVSPPYLMGWADEDLAYYGGGFYGKEASKEVQDKFMNRFFGSKAEMNRKMDLLNDAGQKKAIEHVELLAKVPEYQRRPDDSPEE